MQKIVIIGNLTADPQSRVTQSGISVCSFTVAVNRRHREGQEQQADFFRVNAWRQLGELCGKYLAKGRKVAVTGSVSVSTYKTQDGTVRASMDVTADDVEFLSPKEGGQAPAQTAAPANDYVEVAGDDLPF